MPADSLQKQGKGHAGRLFGRASREKGQSGNPAGRRPGRRNRASLAAEVLLEGEADNSICQPCLRTYVNHLSSLYTSGWRGSDRPRPTHRNLL